MKPRLSVVKCAADPDCEKTQKVEKALGVFRWTGATAGTQGTCVFEPAEWVTFPGKVEADAPLDPKDLVTVVGCENVERKEGLNFEVTAVKGLPCTVSASTLHTDQAGETEILPAEGLSIVVKLGPAPADTPRPEEKADVALVRALSSSGLPPQGARDKKLDKLEADTEALLKSLQ